MILLISDNQMNLEEKTCLSKKSYHTEFYAKLSSPSYYKCPYCRKYHGSNNDPSGLDSNVLSANVHLDIVQDRFGYWVRNGVHPNNLEIRYRGSKYYLEVR